MSCVFRRHPPEPGLEGVAREPSTTRVDGSVSKALVESPQHGLTSLSVDDGARGGRRRRGFPADARGISREQGPKTGSPPHHLGVRSHLGRRAARDERAVTTRERTPRPSLPTVGGCTALGIAENYGSRAAFFSSERNQYFLRWRVGRARYVRGDCREHQDPEDSTVPTARLSDVRGSTEGRAVRISVNKTLESPRAGPRFLSSVRRRRPGEGVEQEEKHAREEPDPLATRPGPSSRRPWRAETSVGRRRGPLLAYSADVQQRPSSTPFAERERDRTDLRTAPVE